MELMDVTVGLLSTIYQMFWECGEVPADWKLASIKHIQKKEKREDAENDRPVTLTSVSGKAMKKIALGVTERYLKNKATIRHSQCGLVKRMSCLSNLTSFQNMGV